MTSAEAETVTTEIDLTGPSLGRPPHWGARTVVIHVGIVHEHEMFALGIKTCLAGSPVVKVSPVVDDDIDVAIVSPRAAKERRFTCPLVVCGGRPSQLAPGNDVMAVLDRDALTAEHLLASIHAAAAGLRVMASEDDSMPGLDRRGREVLALLAAGAHTKEIADQLGYSYCTIKTVIRDVQVRLGTKTRVEAVAEGIRQGLI